MLKELAAKILIQTQLQRMMEDVSPLNRLLGQAVLMQCGKISETDFRIYLGEFFGQLNSELCKCEIDLRTKARHLDRPGGYKTDVLSLKDDSSSDPHRGRFDMWARRFGLLRRLGIRSDVLIVRSGEQIPPHGHSQVVSGFYVLEGRVAIRHYDRVEDHPQHLILRKVIDTELDPGGFTTNSEYHHNIHWLLGVAPVSYLLRLTVTDVPVRRFGSNDRKGSRIYVDPTVAPDASGLISAPYISEHEAKMVRFIPEPEHRNLEI